LSCDQGSIGLSGIARITLFFIIIFKRPVYWNKQYSIIVALQSFFLSCKISSQTKIEHKKPQVCKPVPSGLDSNRLFKVYIQCPENTHNLNKNKNNTMARKSFREVNPMLNLLKRTMTYPGLEPGTFGVAINIPNHYTI
jgi:hypothetical protein